jgi:hypothetical protein
MSLLLVAGCSQGDHPPLASESPHFIAADNDRLKIESGLGGMSGGMNKNGMGMGSVSPENEENDKAMDKLSTTKPSNRRVIFDSRIDIRVDSFDGTESKVSSLVDRHGGFISDANVSHQVAHSRSGTWTIRVPVTAYRQLLDSVGSLGELESRKENADDVTAEFYDLEARIKNKKLLEERIAKLLDENNSELRKMIEVEHELSRVREEIERMQGRLRFLTDVTRMSTIHLSIVEREKAPAPVVAATFSARIANAWNLAVTQATATLQNAIVALIENVFHIAFVFTMLLTIWSTARYIIWRSNRSSATATS